MSFKIGDRLKYIGDGEVSVHFDSKGELCTVVNILRNNKLRVKFDHPKSIGHYRIYGHNFIGVCGLFEKRIKKHKMF